MKKYQGSRGASSFGSLLLISLFSVFLSLSAAEVAVRIWNPLKPERGESFLERPEKGKNSLGLRGRKEYPFAHSNYRILAIGDSFTYGLRLKDSGSWPRQLEKILQKQNPQVEVLNGGRPGTNTTQQLKLFNKAFHQYQPNLVLMGFLLNDCTALCSNCGPVLLKQKIQRAINRPSLLGKISYLYRMIHVSLLKKKLTRETIDMYKSPYRDELESYGQCTTAFREWKKKADEQGFRFAVVIYPMLFGLDKEYPFAEEHKKIKDYLASIGVEAFDITDAFLGQKDTELWVHPANSHPNRRANAIAARRIAEVVQGMGVASR